MAFLLLGLPCLLLLSSASPAQAQAMNLSGSAFDCEPLSDTSGTPTSVHRLRPTDVNVIGAMGDSNTAAFGALSSAADIYVNLTDYRGLSWSIGKLAY